MILRRIARWLHRRRRILRGLEHHMETRGHCFHLEVNSIEDFQTLVAIIRGEAGGADTQPAIDAIAAKINQSISDPLKDALDQQKET